MVYWKENKYLPWSNDGKNQYLPWLLETKICIKTPERLVALGSLQSRGAGYMPKQSISPYITTPNAIST